MFDFLTGPGDYYDDVDDFMKDDQTIEVDISNKGMKKRLRIRSLSFAQMEKINKLSQVDSKLDNSEFVINTIIEGVVRPRFNSAQAKRLLDAHGETVKEIAENIWQLGRISKTTFDDYLKTIQELNDLPDTDK
jgi:hypothetical protein